MMAHFKVPLNLPHAATIVDRISMLAQTCAMEGTPEHETLNQAIESLYELLGPIKSSGENPPSDQAVVLRDEAAKLGRVIVKEVVRLNMQDDRLGQRIRNFFECLELGEEGAVLSLEAGEDPGSLQRPT